MSECFAWKLKKCINQSIASLWRQRSFTSLAVLLKIDFKKSLDLSLSKIFSNHFLRLWRQRSFTSLAVLLNIDFKKSFDLSLSKIFSNPFLRFTICNENCKLLSMTWITWRFNLENVLYIVDDFLFITESSSYFHFIKEMELFFMEFSDQCYKDNEERR